MADAIGAAAAAAAAVWPSGPGDGDLRVLGALLGRRAVPAAALPSGAGLAAADLHAAVARLAARGMVEVCRLHGAMHLRLTPRGHLAAARLG